MNASRPPASTAGASRGSVTWRNVESGPAPRSNDASSRSCVIPTKRARTTSATTDALKTTCAISTDSRPSGIPTSVKKSNAAIPNTISGVTSVIVTSASSGTRTGLHIFGNASATIVPRMQAMTALPVAITSEFLRASVTAVSCKARPNHLVENPSQISVSRPPLNEYATTTTIGA